jgi:hypothetical protein
MGAGGRFGKELGGGWRRINKPWRSHQ